VKVLILVGPLVAVQIREGTDAVQKVLKDTLRGH